MEHIRDHHRHRHDHDHRYRHEEFGEHRHSRRGRSRLFEGGDLRLVLLALLEQAPAHGYELIKAIEDRTGGGYSPSPGVIYPTLTLIEELGLAAVASVQGSRKLYALTDAGRTQLAEQREMADAILARMAASAECERPPQLVRAVENLKVSLRLRLARGKPTAAEIDAIAAALDAAALAVERA